MSLAPHITEVVFAAGAGEQLIGAVSYSDYPEAAKDIPRVGSYDTVSYETLISLKPDLVLAWHEGNGDEVVARLESLGLNVYVSEPRKLEDVALSLRAVGKLTGNAIRVPIPNVSMAILNLTLGRATTREEVNEYMRDVALHSPLRKQIDYSNSPEVVSSDLVGSRHACVYDAQATIVNGTQAVVYLWYDNEFGYSCQVHRLLEQMGGITYASYPKVV